MNDKQKFRKKKKKEKKSKENVMRLREKVRGTMRKIKEEDRKDYESLPKGTPLTKTESKSPRTIESLEPKEHSMFDYKPDADPIREKMALDKLKRNMEILKALEEAMIEEERQRAELNKYLEESGATTLKEKIELMGETAEEIVQNEAENSS